MIEFGAGTIAILFVSGIAIYLSYIFYIAIPSEMAVYRGRSPVFWVIVAILASPLFAIGMLWMLGGTTADVDHARG